jgi:multidrug efflux pump subunit AcrA (membrane-fusion protein)
MKFKHSKSYKLIKDPKGIRKIANICMMVFFLILFLIAFLPWQQTASGSGRVIAYSPTERQQNISAPVDGRLGKWYVQEGSHVKKGAPIIDIYDNDPTILQNLQTERVALTNRLGFISEAAKTAKLNVDRQHSLYEKGIAARKSYEQANLEYTKLKGDEENIKAELARMEVKLSRQHSQRVLSPMDGVILRRYSGQESVLVKAGDIIAELVPDTNSRAVEMLVDGNDVPLINVGDEVRLQFEGWPGIQFSGWPSIAIGTFGGAVAVVDAADNGTGEFRILVVPGKNESWPEPRYLRQGVRAHGWVLLGRVSLWFELWRRFNGFPPTQNKQT